MKIQILILALATFALSGDAIFFSPSGVWNDLKVTFGINPFNKYTFSSMPRTKADAISYGWTKEKSCCEVNGNRYVLEGDRAVMLIFDEGGLIAGISTAIPKNLPFNFPSSQQQDYMVDEGDVYTLTAYFIDPSKVCQNSSRLDNSLTGDRLVFKGSKKEISVPKNEKDNTFWTKGLCFKTMGQHYWGTVDGKPVDKHTNSHEFFPAFLLYNSGKLNGFGWAINAHFTSKRYEHPDKKVLPKFFTAVPDFFTDEKKAGNLSTMHIYLDSTPRLNFC